MLSAIQADKLRTAKGDLLYGYSHGLNYRVYKKKFTVGKFSLN